MAFETAEGKTYIVSVSPCERDATLEQVQALMAQILNCKTLFAYEPEYAIAAEIVSRGVRRLFKN
jgi:hypothetical protein